MEGDDPSVDHLTLGVLDPAVIDSTEPRSAAPPRFERHPLLWLLTRRVAAGVLTLWLVSILVFAATQALPGNAAQAALGQTATPERVRLLERQMHLGRPAVTQYELWLKGLLTGRPGVSLTNGASVTGIVVPRLLNSAGLVLIAGLLGSLLGVVGGVVAAWRRDSAVDHVSSVLALGLAALPEFVVAVSLVALFSTVVFHLLPAISFFQPTASVWAQGRLLVLPVATLVLVITPYIFRMTRAAMVESLQSDYVETAILKGLSPRKVLFKHALPNAIPPIIQVIGINVLYLAGGIVIVEYIFNFPGIGQALVSSVSDRDIPTIQFIVVVLAAFYVVVNIATDVISLLATPRRRLPRR
jgi:peptide/nickel transport system permease protein